MLSPGDELFDRESAILQKLAEMSLHGPSASQYKEDSASLLLEKRHASPKFYR